MNESAIQITSLIIFISQLIVDITIKSINYIYNRSLQNMMNFANIFNQFRSQNNNNGLTDLLDQPTLKISRLLDQDSFLNEYKSSNPKVIEFMKYKRFQQLLEFVTVVGPADDKKRSYKYPLSACDILSVDNNIAIEYFFPDRLLTVDQKVIEDIEVDVEIEVEQSLEPLPEPTPEQPPKTAEPTDPAQTIQQKETPTAPADQPQIPSQKVSQTQVQVLNQTSDKKEEQKTEPVIPQKKFKKVIKKENRKVQKIIKKEVEPLISKLMAYFDEPVNYTLAGYVSKILSVFFVKKPAEVMKYLLQQSIAQKLLNHAESRSVGELIIKILTNQSNINLEKRRDFFKAIIKKMSISSQIYVMSNISSYVCEIIEKIASNLKGNNKIIQFNNVFFLLQIIQQVIRNVMNDDENISVYNAPILFTYLTNVPFILPDDENIVEQFKKLLQHFIEKSCQKLQVKFENRPKLGTGRVKIIQILRFILKQNVLNCKQIIAKRQDFFKIIINLMKQYQMNNMLHNQLMKIIQIALTEKQNSALNNAILKDNILITLISQEASEDKKIKSGESAYQHRKGYIAHIINLAVRLKDLSETNQNIKNSIQNPEFTNAYEAFIEKQIFKNRKTLAGFALRKDIKHQIMFQREEIISTYLNFLQKCPSPVYQKTQVQEPVNIQHPDLVQELQKQLEQNLTLKNNDSNVQPITPQKATTAEISITTDHTSTEPKLVTVPSYSLDNLEYYVDELTVDW